MLFSKAEDLMREHKINSLIAVYDKDEIDGVVQIYS